MCMYVCMYVQCMYVCMHQELTFMYAQYVCMYVCMFVYMIEVVQWRRKNIYEIIKKYVFPIISIRTEHYYEYKKCMCVYVCLYVYVCIYCMYVYMCVYFCSCVNGSMQCMYAFYINVRFVCMCMHAYRCK